MTVLASRIRKHHLDDDDGLAGNDENPKATKVVLSSHVLPTHLRGRQCEQHNLRIKEIWNFSSGMHSIFVTLVGSSEKRCVHFCRCTI
mmetsp:Transcript_28997/g.79573  ORF Transcript_28997/g.79573 Transcript_28997/m.79573 type:complete len:88 (-) Transcript_28997:1502-1765(-)